MKKILVFLFLLSLSPVVSQNFWEKGISLEQNSDLEKLVARLEGKKLILIGESSHGNHEFYQWRSEITRQAVKNFDINFIAVEGDFVSLYPLNLYVKNKEGSPASAREVLAALDRWPVWVWSNEETAEFVEWLRKHNDTLPEAEKIGFYGIDHFNEWLAMEEILNFLADTDPAAYEFVKEQYHCFHPMTGNSWNYAEAVVQGAASCEEAVSTVVRYFLENEEPSFYLLQNAKVIQASEAYHRLNYTSSGSAPWNSRVEFMEEILYDLFAKYASGARGIVWAHNTHVGDARFCSMSNFGLKNIGQLARERFGEDQVFIIGQAAGTGSVRAGLAWGNPMESMKIPDAVPDSAEDRFQRFGKSFYMIFDEEDRAEENLEVLGLRAIGVVYNPENDPNQFVPSIIPYRFDALIYLHKVSPLEVIE